MYLSDAGRNAQLTGGLASTATYLSVHSSNPSTTGANEVSGGSPAYARKAITWATAAAGQQSNSTLIQVDLAAGDYYWLGLWTASTSGTFLAAEPFGQKPLRAVASSTTGLFTQANHGFLANTQIVMFDILASGLPTSFTEGTIYYVVNPTTNTFQLATTSGGSAITSTSATEVFLQEIVKVSLPSQGTADINIGSLVLDATLI